MRRRSKIDSNQPAIVKVLRDLGVSVLHTHTLGQGAPDIIVGMGEYGAHLVEIKDGTLPPSKRRLTPDEAAFHQNWHGTVHIIESEAQAIEFVNAIREAGL